MKKGQFQIRYNHRSTRPWQVYLNGCKVRSFESKDEAEQFMDAMSGRELALA